MRGIDDYDFEDKNRWRRMMWYRVGARLKGWGIAPHDALGLYLVGPDDLDRDVALQKGFRSENLIAVDLEVCRVTDVRKDGALALQGNIFDVMRGWTHKDRPQVVYADLCSNLAPSVLVSVGSALFGSKIATNCVVVINFQRGREPTNRVRDWLDEEPAFATRFARDMGVDIKHRGFQFLVYLVGMFDAHAAEFGSRVGGISGANDTDYAVRVVKSLSPQCLTYRGKCVDMDSVIFTWTLKIIKQVRNDLFQRPRVMKKVKQRTAAVMAVRTMKRNSAECLP